MLGSPLKEIDLKICNNLGLNYDKYVTFTISKKFDVRNDNLDYLRLINKALKQVANSPAQKATIKKIDAIKGKYINPII